MTKTQEKDDLSDIQYTEEENKIVAVGKIKNQYIFDDTAKTFAAITKHPINLNFDPNMKIEYKTKWGGNIERPLINIDYTSKAYDINIPADHSIAESEQDVYSYFLMRPIAQVLAKTDKRNFEILMADNPKLNKDREAVREIWETVENHRVESFYDELRLGTYADIKRLNKRSYDGRKADNVIDIVKAVHAGRSDLIPNKLKEIDEPLRTLFSRVEKSDAVATNIISKKIFEVIQDELERQKEEKQEKQENQGQQQTLDPNQGQQQGQQGLIQPEKPKRSTKQQQQQQQQQQFDNFVQDQLDKAVKQSRRRDANSQNYTKIEMETEEIEKQTQDEDTQLENSNQRGSDMIDDISRKLASLEKQKEKPENNTNVDYQLEKLDARLDGETDEMDATSAYKKYDQVLSRQLKHLFQNIQTKFRHIRSDSSGSINIKRAIALKCGDINAKPYDRNIKQTGVNVRFVIDCSESMKQSITDSSIDNSRHRVEKMTAAKELLITLLEGVKGLEEYINMKIIAYSSYSTTFIDRQRVETLAPNGNTPTQEGIRLAHNDLKKIHKGEKLIVHLSDGEPNLLYQEQTRRAIELAEKDGIKIFTVMLRSSDKILYDEQKELEKIFGKEKFEIIADWNKARRIMIDRVAGNILSMLQGL